MQSQYQYLCFYLSLPLLFLLESFGISRIYAEHVPGNKSSSLRQGGPFRDSGVFELWPDNTMLYSFGPRADPAVQGVVESIINEFNSGGSCFKIEEFKGKENDTKTRLEITSANDRNFFCYTKTRGYPGKDHGPVVVNFASLGRCNSNVITQTLLWAAGLIFEQTRLDRDDFIFVGSFRVEEPDRWTKVDSSTLDDYGSSYDMESIMHLPRLQHDKVQLFHINLRNPDWANPKEIGMTGQLSSVDWYRIQRMYDCCYIGRVPPFVTRIIEEERLETIEIARAQKGRSINLKFAESMLPSGVKMSPGFAAAICAKQRQYARFKILGNVTEPLSFPKPKSSKDKCKAVTWKKCQSPCHPFSLNVCNGERDRINLGFRSKNATKHTHLHYMPHKRVKRGGAGEYNSWNHGLVYYQFEARLEQELRDNIVKAMKEIEEQTCLSFNLGHTAIKEFIFFTSEKAGCTSDTGRAGIKNAITGVNLDVTICNRHGIILHHLMGAIGFWNEHLRPDRDIWIDIDSKAVDPVESHLLNKIDWKDWQSYGSVYDYGSIMHVPLNAFSINNKQTISTKRCTHGRYVGQQERLSKQDVYQILMKYGCCGSIPHFVRSFFYPTSLSNPDYSDEKL